VDVTDLSIAVSGPSGGSGDDTIDPVVWNPDALGELQHELVLTARARRELLDQAVVERKTHLAVTVRERTTFLILTIVLVLAATYLALLGSTAATVLATLAAGTGGLLLRKQGTSPPADSKP